MDFKAVGEEEDCLLIVGTSPIAVMTPLLDAGKSNIYFLECLAAAVYALATVLSMPWSVSHWTLIRAKKSQERVCSGCWGMDSGCNRVGAAKDAISR